MRRDARRAGRRFFWERVGSALPMTRMRFDTADGIELPEPQDYEFITGRVRGRDFKVGSYLQVVHRQEGTSRYLQSAVLTSVDGLPDDVEVSVERLGAVARGRDLRERVECSDAKDKIVTAPASTAEMGGLELIVGADLPSFIEQMTEKVLCSLHGGIRVIGGRHWVGITGDDPYPSARTLKRAIASNASDLEDVGIAAARMVDHVQMVMVDAAAIDRQFSESLPPIPPPRSRIKKRR